MRGSSKARRTANESLIKHPCTARRTHERFVIESGAKQRRSQGIHRHQIEFDGWPRILAPRGQPLDELRGCSRDIGLGASTVPEREKTIGLLDARGQQAARSMVFEAAAYQPNPVG